MMRARHPHVKTVAVIVREDEPGRRCLVAYVVPQVECPLDVEALRTYLQGQLPDYMIPVAFVSVDGLPFTPNGKLDRHSLPAPSSAAYASKSYEAPRGETEEMLARAWREVLAVENIGRRDHFFDLGGNSVSAMQVLARVESTFSVVASVRVMLEKPTIRDLALQIEQLRHDQLTAQLAAGGAELSELLEAVASMSEGKVAGLLGELRREAML